MPYIQKAMIVYARVAKATVRERRNRQRVRSALMAKANTLLRVEMGEVMTEESLTPMVMTMLLPNQPPVITGISIWRRESAE